MTTRRSFLTGLVAAPVVIRTFGVLMPINDWNTIHVYGHNPLVGKILDQGQNIILHSWGRIERCFIAAPNINVIGDNVWIVRNYLTQPGDKPTARVLAWLQSESQSEWPNENSGTFFSVTPSNGGRIRYDATL